MHGYKPKFLRTVDDFVVGTVADYQSSEDGDKTILFIDANDGQKVSVDPYDNALTQCLAFLKLESPSDLIGETWRFGRRAGSNGKMYFDIKRASPEDASAPAPAPAPASTSGQTSAPAPAPAATMSVQDAAAKYDQAVQFLVENTVPRLERKLMGDLGEAALVEFVHGAAATILIATTPRTSSFPPKSGGGGWKGGGKPAWKK